VRDPSEFKEQQNLLRCDLGLPGSGTLRYAAAMYFYNNGLMSSALLEIYRRCSPLDGEDPIDLAAFEGIAVDPRLLSILSASAKV
jgi:hypothetical protein